MSAEWKTRSLFPPGWGSNDSQGLTICVMSANSWTGKVSEAPESSQNNVAEHRRWEKGAEWEWEREGRTAVYYCWLPAVDGNWTEQVPSIILAGEEDRRGEAWLWGCSTFGTTWLATHSQIHFPACQSANEAQCHCSTSVTYSDPVPVSELIGRLSCQSKPYYRHCK